MTFEKQFAGKLREMCVKVEEWKGKKKKNGGTAIINQDIFAAFQSLLSCRFSTEKNFLSKVFYMITKNLSRISTAGNIIAQNTDEMH